MEFLALEHMSFIFSTKEGDDDDDDDDDKLSVESVFSCLAMIFDIILVFPLFRCSI